MKISKKDVEHVAKLARLDLTEEEKEKFSRQLSNVLSYVDKLREVKTEGVSPTAQITGLENVSRDDMVGGCDAGTKAAIVKAFPSRFGDQLKVKRII